MNWFGNNSTRPITFEQSAAYNAAKGAVGEQPAEPLFCAGCGAPDTTGWACCSDCWPEDDEPDLEEYDRDRLDDR